MKKLSIITICYNDEGLYKTCESIVSQTFQDFEWIVIDGGSKEKFQKIFEKYKYRIDKFISEKDTGIYNAQNKGINLAEGEYINFMNAGDSYFYNDALKDVFEGKKRTSDILYGNEQYEYDNPEKNRIALMPKTVEKKFLYISTIRHQSSFIKRELFLKYGNYNENYRVVSDYEKWFVFILNGADFEYLPYIIANHNMNGISHNTRLARKERRLVIEKFFTKEERKKLNKEFPLRIKLMDKIFSIKKDVSGTSKIVTIMGLQFGRRI